MPGYSGGPVVTTLVCFIYFAREAAGALGARHSPRPRFSGRTFLQKLGRIAPRDRGVVFEIGTTSLRRSSTSDGGSDEAIQTWFGTVLRARSVYAFASLKLSRKLLPPHGLRMAAPRLAGKGEAWWGRKDSNLR